MEEVRGWKVIQQTSTEGEPRIIFQTNDTTKQLATSFPRCVCAPMYMCMLVCIHTCV